MLGSVAVSLIPERIADRHKPHVPWIMPQRFLDMQLPLAETDIASRDTPADGYCNISLFRCAAEFGAASDPMLDRPLNLSTQQLNRQHYRRGGLVDGLPAARLLVFASPTHQFNQTKIRRLLSNVTAFPERK